MTVSRNLVANLAGQAWTAALNLAAVPIYVALLGIESFGLIGLNAVAVVLVSFLDAGMATTVNREMVRYRAGHLSRCEAGDLLRSVELMLAGGGVLLALIAVFAVPHIARHVLEPAALPQATVATAMLLMILSAIMRALEAIYRAAMLGLDRVVLMNGLSIASATSRVLGPAAVLAAGGGTVLTFFYGQLVVGVGSLIVFLLVTHGLLGSLRRSRFRLASLRRVAGFAGGAFGLAVLTALVAQSDKLVLTGTSSLEAVGYYLAAGVAAAGIYQLALPVFHSFYPRLSDCDARSDIPGFRSEALRASLVVSALAGAPVAVMVLHGDTFLYAWTGDADLVRHAAPLLAALALGALAHALVHALLAALLAAHRQEIATRAGSMTLAAMIPLMVIAHAGWQAEGIALVWVLMTAMWLSMILVAAGRDMPDRMPLVPLLACLGGPSAVAFVCANVFGLLPFEAVGERLPSIIFVIAAGLGVLALTAVAARELDRSLRQPVPEAT